jgi:general secretion pathway protein D
MLVKGLLGIALLLSVPVFAADPTPNLQVPKDLSKEVEAQKITTKSESQKSVPEEVTLDKMPSTAVVDPVKTVTTSKQTGEKEKKEITESPSEVSVQIRPADKDLVKKAEEAREQKGITLNVSNQNIGEIIKQISRATGKNFILDGKVRGEVTIISDKKMTPDELYEAFLSALDVAGFTTVDGPAGLIKVVNKRQALASPIPIYTKKTPFTDRMITRLVQLKNINSSDMATAIKGLISREGNLFAYPQTNTLILTDTGTNIDRIVRLVNELDTEGPQEVLEIIPISFADVSDMADKVTKLFGSEDQPKRRPRRSSKDALDDDSISKIIADERTNSLIILASKITIARVKEIVRKLDRPLEGPEDGEIHVLYLKNAKASELAEVLTGVTQAVKSSQNQRGPKPPPGAPNTDVEGLLGSIQSIKADDSTNALIIQANAKDFRSLVERIIDKLDIPRRQVYIEAFIMEVSVRKGLDLGTGAIGGKPLSFGGNSLALFGNTFPFIGDVTSTGSIGGATTNNPIEITAPFSDTAINFPRFFAAFVAQQSDTELNILSTPNILTFDNTESRIKVGDTIPFRTGTALTTGGVQTSNIQREDVALELVVKPQITEGNNVRLTIKQTIEDFSEATNPLEAEAGPATSIRELESEVVVPDKQAVVLGGLMQDKATRRQTKIPILGDIPLLGYLFKGTSSAKRKVNLLIFLTPYIVREPQDFLVMLQKKIQERNQFIDEHFGERARKKIRMQIAKHNEKLIDYQIPERNESTDVSATLPSVSQDGQEPLQEVPAQAVPVEQKPSGSLEKDIDVAL